MSELKLKTVFRPDGHTQALRDGAVKPRTFDIDYQDVPVLIQAFRRMVRGLEFDVCEMAITTYICAKAYGKRFTAIPVFPARVFHHGAILYNTKSGIRAPKDLEGKTVGVHRGYTVTTGVWARAILQHDYGVDLNTITWLLSGDEHVAEYRAPANVSPLEKSRNLEQMLVSGEIPAAVNVEIDHPDVKPLISNPTDAAFSALRETGYYPINHTVVVRDELLDAHPGLAKDVFDAFAEAKQSYVERLRTRQVSVLSKTDERYKRVMEIIGGDPLPYGVEPNRKMIDVVMQYAVEQRIIDRPLAIENLFARGTLEMCG
jgi:4,5-dihydroxyphthalate decarboxylase